MALTSDLVEILHWWVLLFFVGLIVLPVTTALFSNFFDRGYVFAKVLGVLSISYILWVLGSFRLLPFGYNSAWLVVALIVLANLTFLYFNRLKFKGSLHSGWKIWIFEEFLFLGALTTWSYIRGSQPDIRGLEKFMDFGFVNSILKSSYFPPTDMWFSGESINYYYFGHLTTAVLTRLSAIDPAITYNLAIATLFALTFVGAFSIGSNLYYLNAQKKSWLLVIIGLLTAFILTLSSNLHPLYWLLTHGSFSHYWYPDATRFIVKEFGAADNTIHEFPIYSFVVADLHGHLLNLPAVLCFLGLVLSLIHKKPSWIEGMVLSWILAIFYMTNAWDLPIYILVLSGALFFTTWSKADFWLSVLKTFALVIPIFLISFIFNLPFLLHFKNISTGIGFVDFHSPLWMLLVLWGLPALITFIFALHLIKQHLQVRGLLVSDYFVISLFCVSWFLVLLPEFFYVKDIYIHDYQRANTMFKFTYQSFVMFSIATPYVLWRAFSQKLKNYTQGFTRVLVSVPISVLLLITVSYSFFAVRSYYGTGHYRGPAGDVWLEKSYPGEFQAYSWLKNLPGKAVVLQASGDSYTDFDVLSSYTGLPTIQGWIVHEWLWRGSYDPPRTRAEDVQTIYTSTDLEKTRGLLAHYNVSYVVVGTFERQKYSNMNENKFKLLGQIAFAGQGINIYKITF